MKLTILFRTISAVMLFALGAGIYANHLLILQDKQVLLEKLSTMQQQLRRVQARRSSEPVVTNALPEAIWETPIEQAPASGDPFSSAQYQAEISQLHGAIASLEQQMVDLQRSAEASDNEADLLQASDQAPLAKMDDEPAQVKVSTQEKFNRLAQRLQSVEVNSPWAIEKTAAIETTLLSEPALENMLSRTVICAGNLCNIEATLPADMDPFVMQEMEWHVMLNVGRVMPKMTYTYENLPDGGRKLIYYFGEQGVDFDQAL